MFVFRCLRKSMWFRGMTIKENDEVTIEDIPRCGKGSDLTKGENPCFELVKGPAKPEVVEPADNDPRSDQEIRDDIFTRFEFKASPRWKRATILAKEKELEMLQGKDAVLAETEYEAL